MSALMGLNVSLVLTDWEEEEERVKWDEEGGGGGPGGGEGIKG